jgi:hypothetical protein
LLSASREECAVRQLLLLAFAMSVAACGGSPSSPSAPTTPSHDTLTAIHDTLTATGSAASVDSVWSERSGADDRQVYDDFVVRTATPIRTIAWQGMRFTTRPPGRFYISFIADNGGFPLRQTDETNSGRPRALYATTLSIDQVNERPGVTQACDNSPQTQCGSYDYSVTLTTPFQGAAGTRYWLLIQAESPFNAHSGWSWRKGRTDNGFAVSSLAGTTFPWDFAFALRP